MLELNHSVVENSVITGGHKNWVNLMVWLDDMPLYSGQTNLGIPAAGSSCSRDVEKETQYVIITS
jgi:hypothetical protein